MTQLGRLSSLDRRVSQVIGEHTMPISKLIEKHAILIVGTCLSGSACPSFRGYFRKIEHAKSTRNSGKLLELPKVRLEITRSAFFFMGANLFNALPMTVRQSVDHNFRNEVVRHFSEV